jgi:hypothetical protein
MNQESVASHGDCELVFTGGVNRCSQQRTAGGAAGFERMRALTLSVAALLGLLSIGARPPATPSSSGSWRPAVHLSPVVDVGGPRSDGQLVISAGRSLYLFDRRSITLQPFADGPGGYPSLPGDEPYLAVASGQAVVSARCRFQVDDIFVIDQAPHRVWRVDAGGHAEVFALVDRVTSLSGIAFDTTGRFGNRLLVIGPAGGSTVVDAIDCRGHVTEITGAAPTVEGGIAVAPSTFGAFGGDLVAADELSGLIWAVRPDGTAVKIAESGLAHGQDLGVEGLGFVPPGFMESGTAYFADRSTPGNAHPGTGNLLSIDGVTLRAAGVRDGDLIAATEGGASTIAVRCATGCKVTDVASGPAPAHGEGHVVLVADHPSLAAPTLPQASNLGSAAQTQTLELRAAIAALIAVVVLLVGTVAFRLRRRRR